MKRGLLYAVEAARVAEVRRIYSLRFKSDDRSGKVCWMSIFAILSTWDSIVADNVSDVLWIRATGS